MKILKTLLVIICFFVFVVGCTKKENVKEANVLKTEYDKVEKTGEKQNEKENENSDEEIKEPSIKYKITFDTDGGSNILSQTVEKKVTEPKNPSKKGYKFLYWSSNNKKFDFQDDINSDLTLKAVWEKLKDPWKVLWVVFSKVETGDYTSTISSDEFSKIKTQANKFESFIENSVSTLDIQLTIVYEKDQITNMGGDSTFGSYIYKNNVIKQLTKNKYESYDSTIVVADMTSIRSELNYAGLTWGLDLYSFVPFFRDLPLQENYPWFEPHPEQAFVHEWLHQIESWYIKKGYNVPNLHDNASYGFKESNANGWGDWYQAYLSNKLKGGISTGINANWWQYSPTS